VACFWANDKDKLATRTTTAPQGVSLQLTPAVILATGAIVPPYAHAMLSLALHLYD